MTQLIGSEKQISWANDIMAQLEQELVGLEIFYATGENYSDSDDDWFAFLETMNANAHSALLDKLTQQIYMAFDDESAFSPAPLCNRGQEFIAWMRGINSASFIIDRRDMGSFIDYYFNRVCRGQSDDSRI